MNVVLTKFEYQPGGKWDCGLLEFTAQTDLGLVEYREVVPGPRHGPDHAEKTLSLNGTKFDEDSFGGWELPDFEPPAKEGRWAQQFRETGHKLVADDLGDWLAAVNEDLGDNAEWLAVLATRV